MDILFTVSEEHRAAQLTYFDGNWAITQTTLPEHLGLYYFRWYITDFFSVSPIEERIYGRNFECYGDHLAPFLWYYLCYRSTVLTSIRWSHVHTYIRVFTFTVVASGSRTHWVSLCLTSCLKPWTWVYRGRRPAHYLCFNWDPWMIDMGELLNKLLNKFDLWRTHPS